MTVEALLAALSSLSQTSPPPRAIELVPDLAQVGLRVDPSEAARVPFNVPLEPNTVREEGTRSTLWLGPDEWLIVGAPREASAIIDELERSLDGLHRSVVDLSANRVALELGGSERFDVLSTGCAIDLHPRAWHTGMCAQTLFGRAQVILHERAEATRLLVRPSFAGYVVDRLLDAAGRSEPKPQVDPPDC